MGLTRVRSNQVENTATNATIAAISAINIPGLLKKDGDKWVVDESNYLTHNEEITVTGDVTGSGKTGLQLTLSKTGIAAGTYSTVTVDEHGRVTAGSVDTPVDVTGTGAVIQTKSSVVAAASGTTTVTLNNTLPAITAGVQIWSGTITPATTQSQIYISGSFGYTSGTSSRQLFAFLFRGNTCIGTAGAFCSTANLLSPITFNVVDLPNTTSATTYSVRVGGASAHTWRINQLATANFAGMLATSRLVIQELA